ncbi:MAG: tetratricopeptide repeat protein [Planctomycetota bacterium]|nr:tetratricopeptide repeat protein [Planctomycetota bacterium]
MRPARLLLPAVLTALLLAAPAGLADTLELTDGRTVEGLLIPDKCPKLGQGFHVVSRFGPTFVPASKIKARHASKPVDVQIREYLAKLGPKDVQGRLRLARWLKELGRTEEARELAQQILEWKPESPDAHALLGHVRYKGKWMTPDAAKRADGYEKHGDKWYTPAEWKNLAAAEKAKAEAAEKAAAERRLREEVNRAVRLALSPDPAVRSRGLARLRSLEKEVDSKALAKLIAGIDDYIKTVDELRAKAAAAAANVTTEGGMVMGEIRATLSKLKRPIPTFQTNLAAGPVGANAPVTLQLPELEVIKVRTLMAMPATVK